MNNSDRPTPAKQRPKFSVAITTGGYKNLINNTLGDPERAKRLWHPSRLPWRLTLPCRTVMPAQSLRGALLGESLNLSPSPQLGQYYLVPFECKVKGPDGKNLWVLTSKATTSRIAMGSGLLLPRKEPSLSSDIKAISNWPSGAVIMLTST